MKCEKCGKEYWTRECLNCKENYTEDDLQKMGITNNNNFIKIKKSSIQIIIATALVTIALILIYKEYKEYRQEQAAVKMMNALGISGKNTNEIIENSTKMLNEANREFEKQMKKIKEAQKNQY